MRVFRASLFIIAFTVLFVGCASEEAESFRVATTKVTVITSTAGGASTVEFSLPDMMCEDGCAVAVKDILEKQPGVQDVSVDFDAKTATVAVDEATFSSVRTLAELVDKGFDNSKLSSDSTTSDEVASPEATAGDE